MITKFASARVLDVVQVPAGANSKTLRKAAHRVGFEYDPRPGYLYVRSRAISSRTNDNFDTFPAEEIEGSYRSFIGKPVFVNHHNENHKRARGVIIAAALHRDSNPDGTPDTWVEVLMEVDAVRFPKLAKAILAGHIDRTSMGTDVAFSVCSVCNNKATTPLEYCQHIPRMKGQRVYRTTASGKKVGVLVHEICHGLKFFENSLLVEEPADPTAFFLGVEAGPGVVGSKATKIARKTAEHDVTDPERYLDRQPDLHQVAPGERYENPEWLDEDLFEREKNSDVQLTPGQHVTRPWSGLQDSTIHSLNSVHAFFKKAELSPISKCKNCGAEKGSHCDIDCGGVRLYTNVKEASAGDYPLECYGCGETDNTGAKFFQHGGRGRKCPSCGSESVHSPEAAANMAPQRPAESEQRRELATHLVGLHLDNDYDSYHDVQSIVNNSKHPLETAHLVKKYVRGLPSDHPMHQDLRNHGVSHEEADYDQYAQDQHDERDLNPGNIHRSPKDYDRLREAMKRMSRTYDYDTCKGCGNKTGGDGDYDREGSPLCAACKSKKAARKTAIGETIAPKDVDTLRDEECPVCAEKDSYDGDECQVCGFIQPPKMFQDPDLDMAKQVDLRKDNIDGFDPRDPNSDPQGEGQVPQQNSDDPNAVDAQGMPNEVPGSSMPGTDQVGIDPNAPQDPNAAPAPNGPLDPNAPLDPSALQDPAGQAVDPNALPAGPGNPQVDPQTGMPLAPMQPQQLDDNGNPLPSETGVLPQEMPQEGPEGVDPNQPPMNPAAQPVAPAGQQPGPGLTPDDPREMGQTDINQMGQEPGQPLLDQGYPHTPVQPAPPGVQGDVMPTEDIYGQPLGPDGPIPPEEVAEQQGAFAPDGQPYDTAQEGDQSMMLVCDMCGGQFESTPPTTITTDQPMGAPDGIVEGDVCPDCGQGLLVAETEGTDDQQFGAAAAESEEPAAQSEDKEDTSAGGPPSGGDAGGDNGDDSEDDDEENTNPFGGRK